MPHNAEIVDSKSPINSGVVSSEFLATTKFGKLRMKNPEDFRHGSAKKTIWVCDCGAETEKSFNNVFNGHTKSCGRCNVITKSQFESEKFGKLRMEFPQDLHSGSDKTASWVCECGRKTVAAVKSVVGGSTKSCGRCNSIEKHLIADSKFGRLSMKNPETVTKGSGKKVVWVCDCGVEKSIQIRKVVGGHITSCGQCSHAVKSDFEEFAEKLHDLTFEYPINKDDNLVSWFGPQQDISSGGKPIDAKCPVCGTIRKVRFSDICRGVGLTCGCSTNRVSMGQRSLHKFLEDVGLSPEMEHKVGSMTYDIYVPSKQMLIEYNGLKWHSMPNSKQRDIKKFKFAIDNGYEILVIFEDEWLFKRKIFENLIKNRTGICSPMSARAKSCEITRTTSKIADNFYNNNHYIGPCKSNVNYGVNLNGQPVAFASFKRPTRQSKYDWELVRMASDPSVRVHGIWGKIIKEFCKDYNPKSIVTFADLRLFSGRTYERIGFKFDGAVPSSYYWTKRQKRYNKSSLRKPPGEKRTESEIRTDQGYAKIWDVGKSRYVFTFS